MKHKATFIAIFILGLSCPLVAQTQGDNSQYDKKGKLGKSGLAIVVKNGKVGFVDKDDKVVIPLFMTMRVASGMRETTSTNGTTNRLQATGNRQQPWRSSSFDSNFYFNLK